MKIKKLVLFFLFSLGAFAIIYWMNSNRNNEMEMLEDNQISIRWPESVRTGEKDAIQIIVSLARDFRPLIDQSKTSTLKGIDLPIDQFNINLEARVDLAGMRIEPKGLLSKNIQPGQEVKFNWDISSNRAGEYDGTLWLYMNLVPKDHSSEKMKEVLLAKPIRITITNILGFPVIFIRVFAFTLLLVSTILILIGSGTNNK
ncbi:MAG: hypothetical protein ACYDH1_16505 [Anaerolineaceae bacterium]